MNRYRGRDGSERLWYSDEEIEGIALAELARSGVAPSPAAPAVDLETLIEAHLGAKLDQHAELAPNELGVTEFRGDERPLVLINRELTDVAHAGATRRSTLLGRWRATLAHEAGHVILHRRLFPAKAAQGVLFPPDDAAVGEDGPAARLLRCSKRTVRFTGGPYDWKEVQANKCMAALLMPRPLFGELARAVAGEQGLAPPLMAGTEAVGATAEMLADRFAVSRQAARIRLETCGLVARTAALPAAIADL